uniref:TBC1 domain family member 7 n=1 Tax=Lygus hesperus TaxID=30085 RepID=A0A0A9ZB58_LYGHE
MYVFHFLFVSLRQIAQNERWKNDSYRNFNADSEHRYHTGFYVSDGNLHQNVTLLEITTGKDPTNPSFILETEDGDFPCGVKKCIETCASGGDLFSLRKAFFLKLAKF